MLSIRSKQASFPSAISTLYPVVSGLVFTEIVFYLSNLLEIEKESEKERESESQ